MRASAGGGTDETAAATPGPGTFFNFGERSRENQKAKMLAKLNTPHKRFEKKVGWVVRWVGEVGGSVDGWVRWVGGWVGMYGGLGGWVGCVGWSAV